MSNRMMYGTNKLKMVKPMEGSMTLLQVCCLVLFTLSCLFLPYDYLNRRFSQSNFVKNVYDLQNLFKLSNVFVFSGSC